MDKLKIKADFTKYIEVFLQKNAKLNLISKNDEKLLFEKHIYDSLGIKLFFEKYNITAGDILDIGCGGGFPCVPIAIEYPEFNVTGIDSIRKKINAIENIKSELNIQNLNTICDRAENIKDKFDIITSRAVAPLKVITSYAMPLLNKNGYFIAYKSIRTDEEIKEAQSILKKFNSKVIDIIKYDLPLEENHTRNLIIIRRVEY